MGRQLGSGEEMWRKKHDPPLTRSLARPGAHWCLRICCWIQVTWLWTLVKTAGSSIMEQPRPQLTTPTWTQAPFFLQTSGPPESPCRERGSQWPSTEGQGETRSWGWAERLT